jgi:hypothetical protein
MHYLKFYILDLLEILKLAVDVFNTGKKLDFEISDICCFQANMHLNYKKKCFGYICFLAFMLGLASNFKTSCRQRKFRLICTLAHKGR